MNTLEPKVTIDICATSAKRQDTSGEKMETKILEQINQELKASPIDWVKVHELELQFFGKDLDLLVKDKVQI